MPFYNLSEKEEENTIINSLRSDANKNDPIAQYTLGTIYLYLYQMNMDLKIYSEAINLLLKASDANNSDASFNLSLIALTKQQESKTDKTALHHLKKASKQKNADAKYLLQKFDNKKVASNQDIYKLIPKIAKKEQTFRMEYICNLLELYSQKIENNPKLLHQTPSDDLEYNQQEIRENFSNLFDDEKDWGEDEQVAYAGAAFNLGIIFLLRWPEAGEMENYQAAFEYFLKAAKRGHTSAEHLLELMASYNIGINNEEYTSFLKGKTGNDDVKKIIPLDNNHSVEQLYLVSKIKHYQAWIYCYSFVIACVLSPIAGYEIEAYVHRPKQVTIGVIIFAFIFMSINTLVIINDRHPQKSIEKDKMTQSSLSQTAHRYWVLMYAYSIIITCILSLLLGYEFATKVSFSAGLTIGIISFLVGIALNVIVADHTHYQEVQPSLSR